MQATPVPHTLLISGACTCCVPHRHIPHNSTALICRSKSCHNLTLLPELLRPEPALCCCTTWGQTAKTTVPGFPVSPEAQCYWGSVGVSAALHPCCPAEPHGHQWRCHKWKFSITTSCNPLKTTWSFKWDCLFKPQSQVSGYPYLRDLTTMLLSTITLPAHFLIHCQHNWPVDPSPAENTKGKNLQETCKEASTQ